MKRYQLNTHADSAEVFNLEHTLNDEQRAVVKAGDGPMLVIAGAGSGKTRALTYRLARLVRDGVSLQRILLCTFTNKAAREMVNRVEALLRCDTSPMWAGTFHHIANKVLRREIENMGYGYDKNFTILDRDDSNQLIDSASSDLGLSGRSKRFPKGRALSGLFGLTRSTGESLEDVIHRNQPKFDPLLEDIDEVWQRYRERKERLNVLDFDDLLYYFNQLLQEFPDIRTHYASIFQHVLVDEYQDINPLQAQIINALASVHHNITVVGDDAQSIYSFRGAESRHILSFPDQYPESNLYYLTKNYRSSPQILAIGNRVIGYNEDQFEKQLQATRPNGMTPALVPSADSRQEAEFIAQRIRELHEEEGVPLHEIAILYRIHGHSMELQLALQRHQIPFVLRSGTRFMEQAHVKDVLAFLRVTQNPRDELSWRRMLNIFPGVGPATIRKVCERLEAHDFNAESLLDKTWQKKLPKASRNSIEWLCRLLEECRQPEMLKQPASSIEMFFEQEYKDYLEHNFENATKRGEEILQLADLASGYMHINQFLDELLLFSENEPVLDGFGTDEVDDDAVVLSTIHQAKGLEWKIVFVINLVDGGFPFFLAFDEEGGIQEERRLFYVASTRAKRELYLLYPEMVQHRKWGWRRAKPSRFLWNTLTERTEHEDEEDSVGSNGAFLSQARKCDLLELWALETGGDSDDGEEDPDEDVWF